VRPPERPEKLLPPTALDFPTDRVEDKAAPVALQAVDVLDDLSGKRNGYAVQGGHILPIL
jgi:hypothetical protein